MNIRTALALLAAYLLGNILGAHRRDRDLGRRKVWLRDVWTDRGVANE